ncbi:MAG: Ig-like domain-containing protein [Solirubrobacterales bacterium]
MWISHRSALGALAGTGLATGLGLLLAVTSSAAPPSLSIVATDAVIGQTIQATAQLSESPSAEGEISFEVFGPDDPTCSGPALSPAPASAAVNGEGEYASGELTPPEAGAYHWSAHYSGDPEDPEADPPADSTCSTFSTVGKESPELAATASDGVVNAGIHDEATVSGGFSPTGEVIFRVYGPADTTCLTPLETDAAPLDGSQATSADFLPQQAGVFRWTAEYAGDENNEAVSLPCGSSNQASTVGKASPGLVGVATSDAVVGTPITDGVTLSGGFQAGGQLVFRAYGPDDATCSTTPEYEATVAVDGNGLYSPAGFSPEVGLYRWTVSYAGDDNNEPASLPCGSANQASTVSKASPSLIGLATPTVVVGSAITDGVTLSSGFEAGGQLVFRAYGPGDASCSTTPKYEATVVVDGNGSYSPDGFSPAAGLYRWTVSYSGDENNEPASLACGAPNQASTVGKASPSLVGVATSAIAVGLPITDGVTLSSGFEAGGQLVFRAYGPGDASCSTSPKYEATVAVDGNGSYSPDGFSPAAGLYRWTVSYSGDTNNEAASLPCDSANQASAVGTITATFSASATNATVGNPVTATASIRDGAIPTGQITFRAFSPDDANCSAAAAFSSTVDASGNGSYRSAVFVPSRVGAYRWTVSYSGDPNHAPANVGCGGASSDVAPASPSISGEVTQRLTVGTSFKMTATLQGGYTPGGTITFEIYRRVGSGCAKPVVVGTAPAAGNGTIESGPLVARQPGIYSFGASYSGDAANRGATDPCDPSSPAVQVYRRTPKVKPRAHLKGDNEISIRARLSGAASPSGTINFRLYRPGDKKCKRKPAFSGGVTARSNGSYLLAQYFATKQGVYRLSVAYSGDQRNRQYKPTCHAAQQIRIR